MHKVEYVLAALAKIEQTVERVIANSEQITSYNYYYRRHQGWNVWRVPVCCSLLLAKVLRV